MCIELVMLSSHLILCRPLLLLPPIPPNIRVFSNESTFHMRWPKYWSFSFSISPFSEHPGLISFRMNWLDLLAVQGTFKSPPTPQFKSIDSSALSFLHSLTLMGNRGGNGVRLYFEGYKITADGDCSHEIKRCLLLERKVMTNIDSIFKSRDITLPTKVCLVKAMVFPVVMYGCESWTVKKAERRRTDAFEL